jgi:hypothetical protein
MAEVWIAKPPECPTHGQMKEVPSLDIWMCVGYDGEGCNFTVTMEAWHATFKTIGTIDNGEIVWRLES